jgi:hypothetical protein
MPPLIGTRRALAAGQPAINLTYQFLDRFMVDAPAPLGARTAEPGPGSWTFTDTNSIMSVSGQRLLFNGTNAAADRAGPAATLARLAGRCLLWYWADLTSQGGTGGSMRLGWDTALNASTVTYGYDFSGVGGSNNYRTKSGNSVLETVTFGAVPGWFGLLMRGTGGIALHRLASSGRFQVDWVYALSNAALLHKLFLNTAEARNCQLDNWQVVDFPAPLTTDAAIATSIVTSPVSGQASTMTSNAVVEFTWTIGAAEVLRLDVRRTDADNRWIVECDQLNSTMRLIERNAGVETTRASNARSFVATNVQRIVVICDGTTIKTWQGLSSTDALTACANYTAATLNQGETGVAVAGFATGANLIAWPRFLTLPGI